MSNHCTRCGYYVDPAEKYCLGCGGNLATLRQRYPVDDPLSRLGDPGVRLAAVPKPAPVKAAPPKPAPPKPSPPPPMAAPPKPEQAPGRGAPRAPSIDLGAPTPPVSSARSIDSSADFSLDAPGELDAGASAGDGFGDLDFAALGAAPTPGKPSGMQLFDLDADVGGPTAAIGGAPTPRKPAASALDSDAGSLPTLSFDPSALQSGVGSAAPGARARAAESGSEVYDLDAQLGGAAPAAGGGGEASDIDFSALSGPGAQGGGGGDVDFSNLSTIENSQSSESGGDALDLSLSNFGGGLGELDFSSLVQDASGPSSGAGEAIDFSGLSSIEVAPPANAPATPAAGGSERPSDDVVYDLDLDGAAGGGLGGGSGLGLDDKDVSAMEEDLLKASIISYKPGGSKKK